MVVALGAAERASQPDGARRADAVSAVFRKMFLRLQSAFRRHPVQPVVSRGDLLLDRGVRQQIARKLLACKLVERLVLGEGPQDIIAVGPDRVRKIAVKAGGIRITN